jgi:hypothetical protein
VRISRKEIQGSCQASAVVRTSGVECDVCCECFASGVECVNVCTFVCIKRRIHVVVVVVVDVVVACLAHQAPNSICVAWLGASDVEFANV